MESSPFHKLAAELRNLIYEVVLRQQARILIAVDDAQPAYRLSDAVSCPHCDLPTGSQGERADVLLIKQLSAFAGDIGAPKRTPRWEFGPAESTVLKWFRQEVGARNASYIKEIAISFTAEHRADWSSTCSEVAGFLAPISRFYDKRDTKITLTCSECTHQAPMFVIFALGRAFRKLAMISCDIQPATQLYVLALRASSFMILGVNWRCA